MGSNIFPKADIIIEKENKIVLIKRKNPPFKGMLAIPGGAVENGETVEAAAIREAEEETSLKVNLKEILGVYSGPGRDPRHEAAAVVFIAEPIRGELKANADAEEAKWFDLKKINFEELAFDHKKIIEDYIKWKTQKGTYWSSK